MKMKYLIPAFLAVSLVSGAVLSSDAFSWSHGGSGGYHSGGGNMGGGMGMSGGGMGMHNGSRGNCQYGNMGGMHRGMGQGNNFDAKDMAKHDVIIEKFQDKVRPLREQLFVKSQELQALQNATNPDVDDVKKVSNDIVDIEQKIMKERKAFNNSMEKAFSSK